MCTSTQARGRSRSALRSRSANDMQRSSRLQSTNTGRPPALRIASGVAMKVFEGQSTARPPTPANSSAASAPPPQPDIASAGAPFQSCQAASKRCVIGPCAHCWDSITSSQSACRRARSRWSNPIANSPSLGRVEGGKAPRSVYRSGERLLSAAVLNVLVAEAALHAQVSARYVVVVGRVHADDLVVLHHQIQVAAHAAERAHGAGDALLLGLPLALLAQLVL